jgi:hypothetical protein
VLLDGGLTDGRATPVAEVLQGAKIPLAILTGAAADGLTEAAFATAPRIAKPFSEDTLVRMVRQLLAGCPAMPDGPGGTAPDGAAR